jgi:hypothetical protein
MGHSYSKAHDYSEDHHPRACSPAIIEPGPQRNGYDHLQPDLAQGEVASQFPRTDVAPSH